jgi:endo-alpha-1,4-polygalactosaminidase (GH114 family)
MAAYKVKLTTRAKPVKVKGRTILAIEPEDYTKEQVKALRAAGYTVLGYLSIGSVSNERPYYKRLEPYRLSRLPDWKHEWYLDLREEEARKWCVERAKEIKDLGCVGWWIDNTDLLEYHDSREMYAAITTVLQDIKAVCGGGYIMINGGQEYLDRLMDADPKHEGFPWINGVTQEEVYSRIKSYSGKGRFGTQTKKQHEEYKKHMRRVKRHKMETFLLEYTESKTLIKWIKAFCKTYGMTGYYIAADVNL